VHAEIEHLVVFAPTVAGTNQAVTLRSFDGTINWALRQQLWPL